MMNDNPTYEQLVKELVELKIELDSKNEAVQLAAQYGSTLLERNEKLRRDMDEIEVKLETYNSSVVGLNEQLSELKTENNHLKTNNATLTNQIKGAMNENRTLWEELTNLKNITHENVEENSRKNKTIKTLKKSKNQLESELQDLYTIREKLYQFKENESSMLEKQKNLSNLLLEKEIQVKQLSEEKKLLTVQLEQNHQEHVNIRNLKSKVNYLTNEVEQLKEEKQILENIPQLNQYSSNLQILLQENLQLIDNLDSQELIDNIKETIRSLSEGDSELINSGETDKKPPASFFILLSILSQKKKEEVEKKLMVSDTIIKQLQEEISANNEECRNLVEQIQKLETKNDLGFEIGFQEKEEENLLSSLELAKELEQFQEQIKSLQESIADKTNQIQLLTENDEKLKQILSDLENKNKNLQENNETIMNQLNNYKLQIEAEIKEKRELEMNKNQIQKLNFEISEKINLLCHEMQKYRALNQEQENELQQNLEKVKKLTKEQKELSNNLLLKNEKIENLENEILQKIQENQKLREENEKLKENLENLKIEKETENLENKKKIENLEKEKENIEKEKEEKNQENECLRGKISEIENEKKQFEKETEKMKIELKEAADEREKQEKAFQEEKETLKKQINEEKQQNERQTGKIEELEADLLLEKEKNLEKEKENQKLKEENENLKKALQEMEQQMENIRNERESETKIQEELKVEEKAENQAEKIEEKSENVKYLMKILEIGEGEEEIRGREGEEQLICKIINRIEPGIIDERVLNKNCKNQVEKQENLNLIINTMKAIGCDFSGTENQLKEMSEDLVRDLLVRKLIKTHFLFSISNPPHPLLPSSAAAAAGRGGTPNPIEALLEFVNFYLSFAQFSKKRVENLDFDFKNLEILYFLFFAIEKYHVLHFLNFSDFSLNFSEFSDEKKIEILTSFLPLFPFSSDLPSLDYHGILNENFESLIPFLCSLFIITRSLASVPLPPGSPVTAPAAATKTEAISAVPFAAVKSSTLSGPDTPLDPRSLRIPYINSPKMVVDSSSREERAMRMWVNSLGIPGVFIHNLQDDMKDGIVLLKIIDKIAPGTVAWAKVNKEPKSVYKKGENCNLVITYGLHLGFSLVGIGGRDFVDGNRKYILAIVWQLMQYHLISILCSFSSNKKRINERDIILWANATVSKQYPGKAIDNLKDPKLRNSLFFAQLIDSIYPGSVNFEFINTNSTDTEILEQNAKYILTVARKIGCCIFLVWEDIVELNPKLIFSLLATLMWVAMSLNKL